MLDKKYYKIRITLYVIKKYKNYIFSHHRWKKVIEFYYGIFQKIINHA